MGTHYTNLKIAEDAPDEVVRAAYRALALRYHPDKNSDKADTGRVMQIINDAYATLSDPDRRREYDESLARRRLELPLAREPHEFEPKTEIESAWDSSGSPPGRHSLGESMAPFVLRHIRLVLLAVVLLLWGIFSLLDETPRRKQTSQVAESESDYELPRTDPSVPAYKRPETAPNGQSWPAAASYLPGYRILAAGGRSQVTVDNTQNGSDVFLKLVYLNSAKPFPVRACYLPAHSQFLLTELTPGTYDMRYRNLSTGDYSKTVDFVLGETDAGGGADFSTLNLKLSGADGGKTQKGAIPELEY